MKLQKFSAPWCRPCKTYDPVVDKVAGDLGLEVEKIDVDEAPEKASGVTSVPTTRLLSDSGEVLAERVGAMPAPVLEGWIKDNSN